MQTCARPLWLLCCLRAPNSKARKKTLRTWHHKTKLQPSCSWPSSQVKRTHASKLGSTLNESVASLSYAELKVSQETGEWRKANGKLNDRYLGPTSRQAEYEVSNNPQAQGSKWGASKLLPMILQHALPCCIWQPNRVCHKLLQSFASHFSHVPLQDWLILWEFNLRQSFCLNSARLRSSSEGRNPT